MKSNRFVNVKKLQELLKEKERIENEINSYPTVHCHVCGDTKPKHGFYPLMGKTVGNGIFQTSMFICNRCALTDEQYQEKFGETKEKL